MSDCVIILDSTDGSCRLDAIFQDWASFGLIRPTLWLRSATGFEPIVHTCIPSEERAFEPTLNEAINELADGRHPRLLVVVDASAQVAWSDTIAVVDALRQSLDEDFGQNAPVEATLVILPVAGSADAEPATRWLDEETIESMGPWRHVFVISPEDSPSPLMGNELDKELGPVAAHTIAGLAGAWHDGVLAHDPASAFGPPHGRVRLVRGWSRVVDGGFILDHVARSLAVVELTPTTTKRVRLSDARDELLRADVVRHDLETTPPFADSSEPLTGLAYIWAFLKFAVIRLPITLLNVLFDWFIRPLVRRVRTLIDRLARRLGAPDRSRRSDTAARNSDALQLVKDASKNDMQRLEAGGEADLAGDRSGVFWRDVTARLVDLVDSGKLKSVDVVGPQRTGAEQCVFGALSDRFDEAIQHARSEIETLMNDSVPGPTATSEVEDTSAPPRRWRRLLARTAIWGAVFVAVALILVGLVLPGLALLGVLAAATLLTSLLAALVTATQRLIRRFKAINERGLSNDQTIANLEYWVRHWSKLLHRRGQIDSWTHVLQSLFANLGGGEPLSPHQQRDFLPSGLPTSMRIATGIAGQEHINALATTIRSTDEGSSLFNSAFLTLMKAYPGAFDDTSRHGTPTGMLALRAEASAGLRPDVRNVAREVIERFIAEHDPASLLDGVVAWRLHLDRFGQRSWQPPAGVQSLGPVGRARPTKASQDAIDQARSVLIGCSASVVGPSGTSGNLGARIVGLDGAVTAAPLVEPSLNAPGDRGDDLALRITHDVSGGTASARLAGLGALRPGRMVVVGVTDGHLVEPVLTTIESVLPDGTFLLDDAAAMGSPVVDAISATLVGVVLRSEPTVAAGPILIRSVIESGFRSEPYEGPELDPGLRIPRDVALRDPSPNGSDTTTGESTDVDTEPATEFLDLILAASTNNFVRRLEIDPTLVQVAQRAATARPLGADVVWPQPDGRTLLASHVLEFSVPFEVGQLRFASAGTRTYDAPDAVEL